jgi:hypothetical protein
VPCSTAVCAEIESFPRPPRVCMGAPSWPPPWRARELRPGHRHGARRAPPHRRPRWHAASCHATVGAHRSSVPATAMARGEPPGDRDGTRRAAPLLRVCTRAPSRPPPWRATSPPPAASCPATVGRASSNPVTASTLTSVARLATATRDHGLVRRPPHGRCGHPAAPPLLQPGPLCLLPAKDADSLVPLVGERKKRRE